MFSRGLINRGNQRKRPAPDHSNSHQEREKSATSSSRRTQRHYIHRYDKSDKLSSRKVRALSPLRSTSRGLDRDRHSRRRHRGGNLKIYGSKQTDKGAARRRKQDGGRRCKFDSSAVNKSTGGEHESSKTRKRRLLDLLAGSENSEHAAKKRRLNTIERHHVKETSSSCVTEETIRHELTYPAKAAGVEVIYTKNKREAKKWLKEHIINSSAMAVGFDTEQKPQFISKKRGGTENETAVLQLAVETSCLVLHIYHMSEFPKALMSILKDKNILKIGSAIEQDVAKLRADRRLVCEGLVDTQDMAASFGLRKVGLKALAEHFLDIELDKVVALSNWEIFPLKLVQIEYAALDAWVGLRVYQEMKRQKSSKAITAVPIPSQNLLKRILNFKSRRR